MFGGHFYNLLGMSGGHFYDQFGMFVRHLYYLLEIPGYFFMICWGCLLDIFVTV